MNLEPRVKFNCSINANGDIVPIDAVAHFRMPTQSGDYAYLLENASGGFEIGFNRPDNVSGGQRFPNYDISSSVAQPNDAGLTCAIIAVGASMVNASADDNSGLPPAPQNLGMQSLAVGSDAKVTSGSARKATAVGHGAEAWYANATALGGSAAATLRGSLALGANARPINPGEAQIGNSLSSHISYVPIRTIEDGSYAGTFSFFTLDGYTTLDELIPFKPAEVQRCDVRVQGTIMVINGQDAQTTRKVFNVDYMVNYVYGSNWPTSILYQTISTLHSGSAVVPASITIDPGTKLPKLTTTAVLGAMTCVGLLTITTLVL